MLLYAYQINGFFSYLSRIKYCHYTLVQFQIKWAHTDISMNMSLYACYIVILACNASNYHS